MATGDKIICHAGLKNNFAITMNKGAPIITLRIRGLGHVPAMKNTKMITRGKLITNPKRQKWMQEAIHSLGSQLKSWFRMNAKETSMGHWPRSLIASRCPLDDSVKWIPELHIKVIRVPKGQEGANIMIERL